MTRSQKLLHLPALVAPLMVGATLPISAVEPNPRQDATVYRDATDTHVPAAPDLHALDAIFVDVDGDGDLDVVLAVEHGENRLYLNDGEGRLTWKRGALGTAAYDTEHVLSADFNADGYPDLIFVAEDDQSHQFFLGGRGGEFSDVTDRLPALSEGNGLAVGDVNGDGLPDIVIGNSGSESGQNFLWLNDPERPGHFIDVTATHLPAVDDDTQDIVLVDLDGDDDLDMLVANETPPSRLLLNDGRGRFSDASERLHLVAPFETRQMHVFDANGDALPDILMLNLTSNNQDWDKDPQVRLLINDGQGRFIDETVDRMPFNTFSTWGGTIVDFNHDAAPDIIVGPIQVPGFVPLQVRAYANDGSGRFSDVTSAVIPEETIGRSWGMAVGDLDGDGVDDIFIGGWGTQARLLLSRPKP
ncbi:FG-GAP repeat domain-containing protein [Luteimonas kalidii]|uniref:VCBS repeat-containing protein n=1 Tax=Luteimonas kalidii TaxID=3042025 RepID=A0ABT6JSC4_9GAMM|nr:VCBS repeat-containing protein [Luteimonas kalidii]MDH5833589.1 VCBS repeat-containing protein [Luteimonas kalidii]